MPLTTGSRLGRYEIRAPLGAGGMGEVYVAWDPKLARDVAVKILPPAFATDAPRLARFEQEASAAGALNHPNVVAVYDVGTDQGTPYVVTELLEGESLRDRLAGGPVPPRKAIEYAAQIARGLAAAHERGIVHRDLKPDNVFITADGRAKILDFGLAKLTQVNGSSGQSELLTRGAATDAGTVLGTVGYMAPEQVRGERVDHRADIFSFGCILYEMLAGRKAFHGPTAVETLHAILTREPPELAHSDRVPAPALERVMLRCLEKSAAARFQSASDLAFALESVSGSGIDTRSAVAASPVGTGRTEWGRRVPWIIGLLGSALAVTVMLLIARQGPTDPEMHQIRFVVPPPKGGTFQWMLAPSSAVSPDGRQLALVITTEGRTQLFVRSLDTPDLRRVPGTDGAAAVFWSPDSRVLGFAAEGKLKRVETAGGSPQTICDAPVVSSGSWSADGTILFGDLSRIFRVAATGGSPAPVTMDHKDGVAWPFFLPDGRHFLYTAWPAGAKTELRVGSLDSPDVKRLMVTESRAAYVQPGYLLYVREGVLLAQAFDAQTLSLNGQPVAVADRLVYFQPTLFADFSASDNGVLAYLAGTSLSRLVWHGRDGAELGPVGEPADYNFPRLSPDGRRLGVSIIDPRNGTSDVWILDLLRGASSRFTADPGVEWHPVWSPDGTRLAFAAHGDGIPNLHVKSVQDGAASESLVPPGSDVQFPWDWVQTPSGRFILYMDRGATTGLDIMRLPVDGDGKPVPWLQSRFDEGDARVAADGKWVAYVSAESGRREVYVRAFEAPTERWQVSTAGGYTPRWRHDGRELYYLTPDGDLMAVPVEGGASFQTGKPVHLFHIEFTRSDFGLYDVSADGQRFLVNVAAGTAPPSVTVAVNWTARFGKP